MGRPLCKCHGEPMGRNGNRRGKQEWTCLVTKREKERARYRTNPVYREKARRRNYWDKPGDKYQEHCLYVRRYQALKRKEQRGSLQAEG